MEGGASALVSEAATPSEEPSGGRTAGVLRGGTPMVQREDIDLLQRGKMPFQTGLEVKQRRRSLAVGGARCCVGWVTTRGGCRWGTWIAAVGGGKW